MLDQAWEDLAPACFAVLSGQTVTLHRPSSLEDKLAGRMPSALELSAPVLAGATAVSLRLPGTTALEGTLVAGTTLRIGAVNYTTTADKNASGDVLAAVPVTPVLAAGFSAGQAVTVSGEGRFTFRDCLVPGRSARDVTGDLSPEISAVVSLPTKGAPTTPRVGDTLELEDGTNARVAAVPITTGGFWDVGVGY
jgi:hypothetical protein